MKAIFGFVPGTWRSLKRLIKELKRVRWPSSRESGRAYGGVVVFIIASGLVLFALAVILTVVWQRLGVGV